MAAGAAISHKAYVEDAPEDIDVSRFLQPDDEDGHDVPPEAPSPPSAIQQNKRFSVFDFYVGQSTPNPSHMGLPKEPSREPTPVPAPTESNEIVPYDYEANGVDRDDVFVMEDDDAFGERESELAPAPAPAPVQSFETPAPRLSRRSLDEDKTDAKKKDKKRKRLHIDTSPPRDEVMTDAPPVLHHSGLTGGLNRMAVFPPSPDYSGGDNEPSPTTPLKKKKHSKHSSKSQRPDGILGLFGSKPSKSKKRKTSTTAAKPKSKSTKATASPKKSSHSHHRNSTKEASKETSKMIEPKSDDKEADGAQHQMILYKPRVDLFMGLVNKGPDSERGCSLNKALKRYHRERSASGNSLSKGDEEKELFRSLRLRRNDRGEIVLFSINSEDADDLLKDD